MRRRKNASAFEKIQAGLQDAIDIEGKIGGVGLHPIGVKTAWNRTKIDLDNRAGNVHASKQRVGRDRARRQSWCYL